MQEILGFLDNNLDRPSPRRGLHKDQMAGLFFKLERRHEAVNMYSAALAELKACLPDDHKYLKATRQSLVVCLGGCRAPRQTALEAFRTDIVDNYMERMDAMSRGEKLPEKPTVDYDSEAVQSIVRRQTYLASSQKQQRKILAEKESKRAEVQDRVRRYQEAQALCQDASSKRVRAERVFRLEPGTAGQQEMDELQKASDALDDYSDVYPAAINVQAALWKTMSEGFLSMDRAEDASSFAERSVGTFQKLRAAASTDESLAIQLADALICNARALAGLDRRDEASKLTQLATQMAPVQLHPELVTLMPVHLSGKTTSRTCPGCRATVPRDKMKKHRKSCPHRIVECKDCEARFPWTLTEEHASECEARLIKCPRCEEQVPVWDMPHHERALCDFSNISCPAINCQWSGPRKDMADHQQDCAFKLVVCDFCFEEMEQHRLPGHRCLPTFGDDICIGCSERFDALAKVSTETMSRAPALLLTKGHRACDHIAFCFGCAAVWQTQQATCPQCRAPYEEIVPLPDFLLIAVEKKEAPLPQSPVPKLEDCLPYSVHMISPLDLHFTQQKVSERFRPFVLGSVKKDVSILDSVNEMVTGTAPHDLESLDVVWHEDCIFVAGSGNRRLTMWRLLALLCPKHWSRMKVRFLPKDHHRVKFDRYFDTTCNGNWIEVRHRRFVGKQIERDETWPTSGDPGILWDDVWSLFGAPMPPAGDEAAFV